MDKNKKKTLIVAVALVAVLTVFTLIYAGITKDGVSTDPGEGYGEAPDFEMMDDSGNKVKLSDLNKKPVIINFWTSWCKYCKSEMPLLEEKAGARDDIELVMLDVPDGERETVESAGKFIKDEGYSFNVYYDTKLEATYNYAVTSFPTTIGVSKDGEIVYKKIGALTGADIDELIGRLV